MVNLVKPLPTHTHTYEARTLMRLYPRLTWTDAIESVRLIHAVEDTRAIRRPFGFR